MTNLTILGGHRKPFYMTWEHSWVKSYQLQFDKILECSLGKFYQLVFFQVGGSTTNKMRLSGLSMTTSNKKNLVG